MENSTKVKSPTFLWEKVAAFAFGASFIGIMFIAALVIPQPTDFQLLVFRVVLALAASGIGAIMPGLLYVEVPPYVRSGGALALFVMIYWFNPATLVEPIEKREKIEKIKLNAASIAEIKNKMGELEKEVSVLRKQNANISNFNELLFAYVKRSDELYQQLSHEVGNLHLAVQSTSRTATELLVELEKASDRDDLRATQKRFLSLVARKSDLELEGQNINTVRMKLANTLGSLLSMSSQLEVGLIEATLVQETIERLQDKDKILELSLLRIDTQQQAVQTEIAAVQRVIDRNIDMSFKTFE